MQNIQQMSERIYMPHERHKLGFFETWRVMMWNIYRSRELIWQLFKRDFLASYKKSFLGIFWMVISPVMGIISWVFLQQTGMLKPGNVGIPYPVYVLVGSLMWGVFMDSTEAATQTLSAGASFIMQVNYPHESLLFKQLSQQLAYFGISFFINIVVLLGFGIIPHWKVIFLPFVMFPLILLAAAIGLPLSMLAVISLDINRILKMILSPLIFLTPVIYADSITHPLVQTLIRWNPMTYLICSSRDMILYGTLYHPPAYLLCTLFSIILFFLSWRVFYIAEIHLIERMN